MSSTLSIVGNMIFPNAPGGTNNSLPIGSPDVTPSSTTGAQLTYDEKAYFEYVIAAAGTQVVNFGSVADGDFVYIGTDQPITYTINGGTEVHSLAAGGFMMQSNASITALTLTSVAPVDATVVVAIFGD
jgi:hypothetical protein